jgi:dTDP-4-amino-4,6-dideoxygalactose transaminase
MTAIGATSRQWPFYSEEATAIVHGIIQRGKVFDSGEDEWVGKVEAEFSRKLAPNHYSLFCGSGTAALYSAYFALNLSKGSEVILPVNSFRATATPLLLLNLVPIFCDVCPATGTIDFDHAEAMVTPRTEAIAVTHMWGHAVDLERLQKFATKHRLAIIEDCSHAHGLQWNGTPVGTAGDVAAFSLGTKKLVSGGSGGMLVSSRQDIFERAVVLGHPRSRALSVVTNEQLIPYAKSGLGANFRGTPIAAALALDHLKRLDETIAVKNDNLNALITCIGESLPFLEPLTWPKEITQGTRYALKLKVPKEIGREALLKNLSEAMLPVSAGSKPLNEQRQFEEPFLSSLPSPRLISQRKQKFEGAANLEETLFEIDTRSLYEYSAATSMFINALTKVGLQYQ